MERNEKERVHDQSHGPVQLLRLGEGTVAAFVGENPDTGEDESLDGGVRNPCGKSQVGIWDQGNICDGEVDEDGQVEVIADDIGHRPNDRRPEAVCGNGVVDLLHGEGRQFEFIAVEVDMLWLLGCCHLRCHGGEVLRTDQLADTKCGWFRKSRYGI